MKLVKGIALLSSAAVLTGCFLDDSDDDSSAAVQTTYSFDSKTVSGESSVSHSGQSTRHLLINELKHFIGTASSSDGTKADILAKLNRIYSQGSDNLAAENFYTGGVDATEINIGLKDGQTAKQATYTDVSGGKKLQNKLAGCDNNLTQDFIGWDIATVDLVECGQKLADGEVAVLNEQDKIHTLIQIWFDQIATQAAVDQGYVTADGQDLQQLVQKLLLGAVTYSQAAEDYMKSTKGLLKQNVEADNQEEFDNAEESSLDKYTSLEHQWDEGFGYFGAARDYLAYSDEHLGGVKQYGNDSNEDGFIDLTAGEYSYGHSINASKRDRGSDGITDFSSEAMAAFIAGRKLITDNFGNSPVEGETFHTELSEHAATALGAWEKAIAATAIHYINDLIKTDGDIDSATSVTSTDYAKHWSELKGFALSLQFSPLAKISTVQLTQVHTLIGEAPATLDNATAFKADLEDARDILESAYGFNADVVAGW
jgi:hypothetical protein